MFYKKYLTFIALFVAQLVAGQQLKCVSGKVFFTSDAPLENIQAKSKVISGLIDLEKNEFAISIPIKSFEGFNSPLQKEHFHENYMESNRFSSATFSGKIIEKLSLKNLGSDSFRAKGMLDIHGVKHERIIKCEVKLVEKLLMVKSEFEVLLDDHLITIPRVVHQKIAEKILVEIEVTFQLK